MAIGGGTTFGNRFGNAASNQTQGGNNNREDLPKAEFWLNIGYYVTVPDTRPGAEEGSIREVFVALPGGIALDTMKHVELKGSQEYVNRAQAQNDLLDSLVARCRLMEPGEEVVLLMNEEIGLVAQLRRVKEAMAPAKTSDNPFARKLKLVPKAA